MLSAEHLASLRRSEFATPERRAHWASTQLPEQIQIAIGLHPVIPEPDALLQAALESGARGKAFALMFDSLLAHRPLRGLARRTVACVGSILSALLAADETRDLAMTSHALADFSAEAEHHAAVALDLAYDGGLDSAPVYYAHAFANVALRRMTTTERAAVLLERFARRAHWAPYLAPYVAEVHLALACQGGFVRALLSHSSVDYLVALARNGRLAHVVRFCSRMAEEEAGEWAAALELLRRGWPGAVSDVLNVPPGGARGAAAHTCPVTLETCVLPTVASDGRIYERDVLMRVLAKDDPRSPITREPLALVAIPFFA